MKLYYRNKLEHLDLQKRVILINEYIIKIIMAFVYRSEVKSTYIPKTENVGPG